MFQPPNECYFTTLLNSNPQQYLCSPNQSNPSIPSSQNSNSSSQPYAPFGTQMTPDQAYQQQLAYHQHQQQFGFQNFPNPRNTPPQYFPSQPQYFPSQSSQPQFKVPEAKEPRDGRRKVKKVSKKQPIVDLDEDDDDDVEEKRVNTRWNRDEEILLTESWVEHSQNASIEKDQSDDVINGDCQRFNAIYKHLTRKSGEKKADHIKNAKNTYMEGYDAAKPVDEDNIAELFGPDLRARPAGKPRPSKKAKSMDTSSARRKCEAAEAVYEAKRKKELGLLECRELEFLMIYPSSLPCEKAADVSRDY
ncbi:hypothetical protein Tco_1184643 [Tanacetum coccineum]